MNFKDSMIEYRPVAGYPGYEVGADGSVWSCLAMGPQPEEKRYSSPWRRLKAGWAGGYLCVVLTSEDGVRRTRQVHNLVIVTFLGERPHGMVARHFPDRNRENCAVTNLRWGTHKENCEDRDRDGNTQRGVKNYNAVLTEDDVRLIRAEKGYGAVMRMARKYGVSRITVHCIRTRKTWTHVL